MTGKHPAAVELGRLGGRVKSEAKTVAVRENAKLPRGPRRKPGLNLPHILHMLVAREASYRVALSASSRRDSLAVREYWWLHGRIPY